MRLDVKQLKKDVKTAGLYIGAYTASVFIGTPIAYKLQQYNSITEKALTSPYAWEAFKTEPFVTLIAGPTILGTLFLTTAIIASLIILRYTKGGSE